MLGKVIALVGPNESGKSSVLQGLQWLTDTPRHLRIQEQNRDAPPESETLVVRARYKLDEDDIEALNQLDLDVEPAITAKTVTEFRLSRRADGTTVTGITTEVQRSTHIFKAANAQIASVMALLEHSESLPDDERIGPVENVLRVGSALLNPSDPDWTDDRLENLAGTLDSVDTMWRNIEGIEDAPEDFAALREQLVTLSRLIGDSINAGRLGEPADAMRDALQQRVPKFVLFTDDDRNIAETYPLGDEALRAEAPPPLRNLLYVAGTTVAEVWGYLDRGDTAQLRTFEKRINRTLQARLQPMWSQSQLTVNIVLNTDGMLEVNIEELDSPELTITPIGERSDGLRAFLALVCFLIAAELSIPPVLMIDEAERNLHYDAQADLVRVLTSELKVHKVLYTTHSPGCLPLDLGTGIRVVVRDTEFPGRSKLSNNFWIRNDPGFSNLLFAMGAEAAAFSAFRRAVLAEGVSDMILLPTLLRNATNTETLDFQVAFGLSSMSASKAIGSVALITTFLVDGDDSGNEKRQQLIAAGVPTSHVFQLPEGKALEDLVDRATYLSVVDGFLQELGHSLDQDRLQSDCTIAKAVDTYAKSVLGIDGGVSHKIIAARLAELGPKLQLTAEGKRFLKKLSAQLVSAFESPYLLQPEVSGKV